MNPLCLTALLCFPPASQAAEVTGPGDRTFVEKHFAEARKSESASDFVRASAEYDVILKRFPSQLPELYQNAGIAYYLNRDYGKAIDRFQAGIKLKDQMIGAHLFLGAAYLSSGRPTEALPQLIYAHGRMPTVESAKFLGLAYSSLGRQRKAAEYFHFCLDRSDDKERYLSLLLQAYSALASETGNGLAANFPDSLQAHLMKAEVLDAKKLHRLAAREYLQGVAIDPFYAKACFLLAFDLHRIGAEPAAQAALARYKQLVPEDRLARFPRGGAGPSPQEVDDKFDYEASLRKLPPVGVLRSAGIPAVDSETNRLLQTNPNASADEHWTEIASLLGRSQWTEAVNALNLLPSSSSASLRAYLLITAHLENGEAARADALLMSLPVEEKSKARWSFLQWEIYDEMVAEFTGEILGQFPDSSGAHLLKARVLESSQNAEAEKEYKAAIAADPTRSGVRIGLADYYLSKSDFEAAIEPVTQELKLNPYSAGAAMRLGRIYLQMGNPRGALEYLEAALAHEGDNPVLRADLGKAFETLGEYDKAVKEYEKSLSLDPGQNRLHQVLGRLYSKLGKPDFAQSHAAQFKRVEARQQLESLEHSQAVRP